MSRPSRSEGARLLRQRAELGVGEIFLDGMTRAQALELAAAARAGRTGDVDGPHPERPEAGSGAGQGARPAAPAARDERPRAPQAPRPSLDVPPSRGAATTSGALPVLPDVYDEVRDLALGCTRCRLADGRKHVVFSDGPPDARLMVVGEAPGANEDETGLPFVGAAGKYLDLLLGTVDLSRHDSVYICNVLKCRPPGNRNPMPDEIEACSPFLKKQIDLVSPGALLAVGSFAGQLLTGRDKTALGKLRGEVHAYHGVPLVVTYHPAALLRNPKWTRAFWDDLQLLRSVLDSR